jgi:hypothetical protein
MKTVAVLIGNSDDKLKQEGWSQFVTKVIALIEAFSDHMYFSGASHPWATWQNSCWVFSIEEESLRLLKIKLADVRRNYLQDSVAIIEDDTEMI